MEGSDINEEMMVVVRKIYSTYDAENTGKLTGDQKEKFKVDLAVSDFEASTIEGFKQKYFKEFKYMIDVVKQFQAVEQKPLTKKSLNFRVNYDDTQTVNTTVGVNYVFNEEKRRTMISDLYTDQKLKAEETFLLIKVYTSSPSLVQNLISDLLEILRVLGKSFGKLAKIVDEIHHEITTGEDYVAVKLYTTHIFFQMIHDTFYLFSKKFPDIIADISVNLEMVNSLDDLLNNVGDDTLRTLINGSKLSLNVTSNAWNVLRESFIKMNIFKAKSDKLAMAWLTLLEFNANFKMNMGEVEKSILWGKLPEMNIFSADNSVIKTFVQTVSMLKDDMPVISKIFSLVESLKGKVELCLNTTLGLIRFKLEGKGLMEVWEMLKIIHY